MAWTAITADDVLDEFNPDEQTSLEGVQGATDKLANILAREVAAARGSIQAGGNRIGADGLVPDQIIPEVIAMARWRWLIAFPKLSNLQTDARKEAFEKALEKMDSIASGKVKVEVPATALDVAAPIGAVEFKAGRRKATGRKLDGLI